MNNIIFSVCAAAMLTAVYKHFVPTDRFGSQMKLLLACFFVLTVIGAVGKLNDAWDFSDIITADGTYNDYSVQIGKITAEETARSLQKAIRERLAEKRIVPEKIYIDVNISDTDSISISEIRLVFDETGYELYADKAIVLVRQMTGTKIKVTAEKIMRTEKERGSR